MAATEWTEYPLTFGFTARTSREVMQRRSTFLLRRPDASMPSGRRYAEANFFESLAPESRADFLAQLKAYCGGTLPYSSVTSSAVRCAADMLHMPLPDNTWTRGHSGIAINGLIWMADKHTMQQAIAAKLQQGFKVLKLKIGGIDFDDELDLIRAIRRQFTPDELEIRLDANGSFSPENAAEHLERLSPFGIHSIEQPVRQGQYGLMAELCRTSPIDIALDEDLIGLRSDAEKLAMLRQIRPAYIILKPTLCGGLKESDSWRRLALQEGIGWWLTSALESSVGLYYLAAFVSQYPLDIPQGLGTGQIYTDNIGSCLNMHDAALYGGPMQFDYNLLDSLHWQ